MIHWGKRVCMFIVQVFQDRELFKMIELKFENGLEMAIHLCHWARDSACSLLRSSGRQSSSSQFRVILGTCLEIIIHSVMTLREGHLHVHCSGFPGYRTLWVIRVIPGRWSWDGHLFVTLGNRLHIHYPGSWDIELFRAVELYLEDGLEMIIH